MKLKPIEPGCTAIITGGWPESNRGKTVKVFKAVKPGATAAFGRYGFLNDHCDVGWLVEGDGVLASNGDKINCGMYCAVHLMRIDDYKSEGLEMGIEDKLTIIKMKEAQ